MLHEAASVQRQRIGGHGSLLGVCLRCVWDLLAGYERTDAKSIRLCYNPGDRRLSEVGRWSKARLSRRIDAVGWIGYTINSVDADFGPIETIGE